jgi:transcription termination factor NusB
VSADTPAAAKKAPAARRPAAKSSARRRSREVALQGLYQWLVSRADGAEIEAHLQEQEDFDKLCCTAASERLPNWTRCWRGMSTARPACCRRSNMRC